MVLDEGVLYRNQTNGEAFVKTKKKLTDDCDLWCVLSLPGGVYSAAGAGVKTNLPFFTKGKPTETVWYCDLSDSKVGKKTPLTHDKFRDFFERCPAREVSGRSRVVDLAARKEKARAETRPFYELARAKAEDAETAKRSAGELKKSRPRDDAAVEVAEGRVKELLKAARDAAAKAEAVRAKSRAPASSAASKSASWPRPTCSVPTPIPPRVPGRRNRGLERKPTFSR